MPLFFIIVVVVLALMYTYAGRRLIRPARLDKFWRTLCWSAVYICVLLPVLPFFLHVTGVETEWIDYVSWAGFISMGFFLLLFTLLVTRDLLALVSRLALWTKRLIAPKPASNPGPKAVVNSERRRFLIHTTNLGILSLSASLAGYGLWEARRRPRVFEVTIPLPGLPGEFDGFRIGQITDIHAGPTVKRDWIQEVVDETNRQAPDLIAFTGDLVDGSVPYLREDVAPMAELTAPHGTYSVTGNHEYYSGAESWIEEMNRIGLTVLMNQHVVIQRGAAQMLLAGVTDYTAGGFIPSHQSDPHAALAGAPPCNPKVLLAHQPVSIYAASEAGYHLQLSGHTHGGQFFPGNMLARLAQPYISGLHKHENTWIYVSRGTGYWGPPLRLGQPSEITIVTLRKSPQPT